MKKQILVSGTAQMAIKERSHGESQSRKVRLP